MTVPDETAAAGAPAAHGATVPRPEGRRAAGVDARRAAVRASPVGPAEVTGVSDRPVSVASGPSVRRVRSVPVGTAVRAAEQRAPAGVTASRPVGARVPRAEEPTGWPGRDGPVRPGAHRVPSGVTVATRALGAAVARRGSASHGAATPRAIAVVPAQVVPAPRAAPTRTAAPVRRTPPEAPAAAGAPRRRAGLTVRDRTRPVLAAVGRTGRVVMPVHRLVAGRSAPVVMPVALPADGRTAVRPVARAVAARPVPGGRTGLAATRLDRPPDGRNVVRPVARALPGARVVAGPAGRGVMPRPGAAGRSGDRRGSATHLPAIGASAGLHRTAVAALARPGTGGSAARPVIGPPAATVVTAVPLAGAAHRSGRRVRGTPSARRRCRLVLRSPTGWTRGIWTPTCAVRCGVWRHATPSA